MEWNKEWTVPVVTGIVSFGTGLAAGYAATLYRYRNVEAYIAQSEKMTAELVEIIEEQKEQLRIAWDKVDVLTNDTGPSDGEENLEEVHSIADPRHNHGPIMVERHSVFPDGEIDSDWNYNEETKKRTPTEPFIIHYDEYEIGEAGYSQSTLTYYAGDDVLTDGKDVPIYNVAHIVGELKFGHGSNDPNIVYVRNDRLEADYEILRDSGSYSEIVLGEEIEDALNHSKEVIRRFRPED